MSHIDKALQPIVGVSEIRRSIAMEFLYTPSTDGLQTPREKTPDTDIESAPSVDTIVFAQYIIYMYIRIFWDNSNHTLFSRYMDSFEDWTDDLLEKQQIVDPYLKKLMQNIWVQDLDTVQTLSDRLNLASVLDTSILYTVLAAYSTTKYYKLANITMYSIRLTDNPEMPIILNPEFTTEIDTEISALRFRDVGSKPRDRFWRIIFGMNIFQLTSSSLYDKMYRFATLALQLNPRSVNLIGSGGLSGIEGIPFVNFVAMAIREFAFGSFIPLANNKIGSSVPGYIMQRANAFYGSQAFKLLDAATAKAFILHCIKYGSNAATPSVRATKFQDLIFNYFNIEIEKPATEAAKPTNDGETADDPIEKKPDEDDEGGIDNSTDLDGEPDDIDPLTDNSDAALTEPDDISDNNIALQGDTTNTSIDSIIPLATLSETINDHLYRLAVLYRMEFLKEHGSPDVSPVDIDTLKVWCSRWLFIADTKTTRNLLAKLKITGLKEFRP